MLLYNGGCLHYIIESKVQWKPFWLATQQYPENDWLGGNFPYTMTYTHGRHCTEVIGSRFFDHATLGKESVQRAKQPVHITQVRMKSTWESSEKEANKISAFNGKESSATKVIWQSPAGRTALAIVRKENSKFILPNVASRLTKVLRHCVRAGNQTPESEVLHFDVESGATGPSSIPQLV